MRLIRSLGSSFCLAMVLSVSARAQAVVEYSVGTTPAATAAPAGKNVGASIGSVFGGLVKTLEKAGKGNGVANPSNSVVRSVPATSITSVESASGRSSRSAHTFEDPTAITAGMEIKELLKRFGEPTIKASGEDATQTFWYTSGKGNEVMISLNGEKVVSVEPGKPPQDSNVIVLR